jgi:hypothetical protein
MTVTRSPSACAYHIIFWLKLRQAIIPKSASSWVSTAFVEAKGRMG